MMSDSATRPTFESIPAELRLRICEYVFADAEIHVACWSCPGRYCDLQCSKPDSFHYPVRTPNHSTAILQVSSKLREELRCFSENYLTVVLGGKYNKAAKLAAVIVPGARTIRIADFAEWPFDDLVKTLEDMNDRNLFPHIKKIAVQINSSSAREDDWWRPLAICRTWNDIFPTLLGHNDDSLAQKFKNKMWKIDTSRKGLEFPFLHDVTSRNQSVEMVFEMRGLRFAWEAAAATEQASRGCELPCEYGLDIAASTFKINSRYIKFDENSTSYPAGASLFKAQSVFILREGLDSPALYQPESRRFQILVDRDPTRPPCLDEYDGFGWDDFYIEDCRYYDECHSQYVKKAAQKVLEQLENPHVLQHALRTAERCMPTQKTNHAADVS